MRIWDQVPPADLCDKHLLAQWREGLGLHSVLTNGKTGYANHPETKRWVGHERAFWFLLERTRSAMLARGWNPRPMPAPAFSVPIFGPAAPHPDLWDDQLVKLKEKGCGCVVPEVA